MLQKVNKKNFVKRFDAIFFKEKLTDEDVKEVLDIWRDFRQYIQEDKKRIVVLDEDMWTITNRIGDINVVLINAGMYEEFIHFNMEVVDLNWMMPNGLKDTSIYENAKREIADMYSLLGDNEKAIELYESYLKEDALWGFGWLGYCWVLENYDEIKYRKVVVDLKDRILKEAFRDKEELQEWLDSIEKSM